MIGNRSWPLWSELESVWLDESVGIVVGQKIWSLEEPVGKKVGDTVVCAEGIDEPEKPNGNVGADVGAGDGGTGVVIIRYKIVE